MESGKRSYATDGGPLSGVRVVEFAGIGPGPFAAMLLSDLGAEVLRIDRPGAAPPSPNEILSRGRHSLVLDLKSPCDLDECLRILDAADILIEGYRPGVMERLGLGPDVVLARHERLIYGRMTGWGQTGPLAHAAGHDINYIAISGALEAMGRPGQPPSPPLNLVGDFGAGSLYLVFGIMAALFEAQRSGKGQVVDAAIIDGAASMMAMSYWCLADGITQGRGTYALDGAAHFYRCYECSDGKYVAVGAMEPHFYRLFLEKIGLMGGRADSQERKDWSQNTATLEALFKGRTRDEWCKLLEGTDACFAPVLSLEEAPSHPQNIARRTLVERYGLMQPAAAPRFSRTPGDIAGPPCRAGVGGRELAATWGIELNEGSAATETTSLEETE